MDFKDVVVGYKRYVEPFIAVFVLIGLVYAGFMAYNSNQINKDIAKECGWVDEEARCTCEKNAVIAAENEMRGIIPEVILDVDMDK